MPAKSGKTFAVENPANEQIIATVAEGDKEDVDEAVKAARKAFEEGPWPRMSPHDRTRRLLKLADLIEQHVDELTELVALEGGKPLAEGRGEVLTSAARFVYCAGWSSKIYGETNPSGPEMFNYTLREPVGVCGQITPWNAPAAVVAMKWAPALACGNTVVLKPAEQTPLTALRLGELALEAGIPEGVINIVTGFGETAGAAVAHHPDIDKVAFTGSTVVGKEIIKASAGNLKRVTLESGGKSPNIRSQTRTLTTRCAVRRGEFSPTRVGRAAPHRGCSYRRRFTNSSPRGWLNRLARFAWAILSIPPPQWGG